MTEQREQEAGRTAPDERTQALPLPDLPGSAPLDSRPVDSRPRDSRPYDGDGPTQPVDGRSRTQPLEPLSAAAAPVVAQSDADAARRPGLSRPAPPGSSARSADRVPRTPAGSGGGTSSSKQRRARLRLRRVDPWSVFNLALLISLFLAVVLVVAVVALYAVLDAAGVPDSVNALVGEISRAPGEVGAPAPLLTASRALTAAGVVAVLDVVLLTALSTLSAVLYNLCASFTGGIEVTLAEDER